VFGNYRLIQGRYTSEFPNFALPIQLIMNHRIAVFVTIIGLMLPGCKFEQETNEHQGMMGVQALMWIQYAAEVEALYLQGYNVATEVIRNYAVDEPGLPPAVSLDIDETVLDNSPFNVHLLRTGASYSEELWKEWCMKKDATPVPGALQFVQLAEKLGIEVFYVSNRHISLRDATLENLQKHGFPFADTTHLLLKTSTSSKDLRREKIRKEYDLILLGGDNLGDFDGIFDNRESNNGKQHVGEHAEEFGTRFIVFPNPIYGSWQRALFPAGVPSEEKVLEKLKGY